MNMLAQTPPHHSTSTTRRMEGGLSGLPADCSNTMAGPADGRCFGSSTDDVAIFLDDTLDRNTVLCLSSSPSAMAILSPQRLPAGAAHHRHHADATDFDLVCNYAAGMSSSAKKRHSNNPHHSHGGLRGRAFATELTNQNNSVVQALSFSKHESSSNPPSLRQTPNKATKGMTPQRHSHHHHVNPFTPSSSSTSLAMMEGVATTADAGTSPLALTTPPPGFVPLAEFERVDKERHRYHKMYEHQRGLYEDMAESQQDTYLKLQDKIVEVVALSTRNEESKKFIRQLKREMLESRTRVLDLHNRQWDESRSDRASQERLKMILGEQEAQFTSRIHQQEAKMAGLEGLVRDITTIRGDANCVQVAQLDQLLKASYTKNAALFGDLVRQGRQLELVMERKIELERTLESMRRERRDGEANMASERRHSNQQNERFAEQFADQHRTIIELRQCLVRAMANAADTSSSGSPCSQHDGSEDEDEPQSPPEHNDHEGAEQDDNNSREQQHMHQHRPPMADGHDVSRGDDAPPRRRHPLVTRDLFDSLPAPPPPPPTSYLVGSSVSGHHGDYASAPVRPVRRLRAVPPPTTE